MYSGEESGESAIVTVVVFGTVPNATDFFIRPLTFEKYEQMEMTSHTDLPTIAELQVVGNVDRPHSANGKCLQ